jgi:hypothetical protein
MNVQIKSFKISHQPPYQTAVGSSCRLKRRLEVKFGGWVAVSAVGREKPTTAENDGCIPPNAGLAGFFIFYFDANNTNAHNR